MARESQAPLPPVSGERMGHEEEASQAAEGLRGEGAAVSGH
jgi:hypothetical protein